MMRKDIGICYPLRGWSPPRDDLFGTYLACLYSAVAMLAGGFLREPLNSLEYAVVICVNLMGLFLWAIVQGVVCAVFGSRV